MSIPDESRPRAEEIIAEVYRQLTVFRERGLQAQRIVIPAELWTLVCDYRKKLGVLENPLPDYLDDDSLFGLEIWYGNEPDIRVE